MVLRVPGSGFRVPGSGFRFTVYGVRVAGFGNGGKFFVWDCKVSPADLKSIHYLFTIGFMTRISIPAPPEEDRLLGHLAGMPDGSPAPVLAELLGVSQPTLSRMLRRLQARGLVLAEGEARSRRYHWVSGRPGLAALRRRRLHELVAHKLVDGPELLDHARKRLAMISQSNATGQPYHDRWLELMDGPLHMLLRKMTEDSEEADQLRKESPFSVLIDADERRALFQRLGQLP